MCPHTAVRKQYRLILFSDKVLKMAIDQGLNFLLMSGGGVPDKLTIYGFNRFLFKSQFGIKFELHLYHSSTPNNKFQYKYKLSFYNGNHKHNVSQGNHEQLNENRTTIPELLSSWVIFLKFMYSYPLLKFHKHIGK